jgi:transcriptional regulator with XRE-family HTH domain
MNPRYTQEKVSNQSQKELSIMQWILQDVPLGRNIQNIRMQKNLTQQEVVEKLQLMGSSMSRSTLANIESGRRNIKASDLKLLKNILQVEYDCFFE